MCHILFQVNCCGHTKVVCTTPCAHAVSTATPAPTSPTSAPDTPTSPHRREPQTPTRHSSVRSMATTTTHAQDNHPASAQAPRPVRTSSVGATTSASLPPPPPPYSPTSQHAPPTAPLPAADNTPNLCAQFFARYLPAGNHPCYACYMDPAYAGLRARWMKMYADGHPGVKREEVERLCGVEGVAERLGLVNVAREVNTAGGAVGEEAEGKGDGGGK